jgi:hypothetical protein
MNYDAQLDQSEHSDLTQPSDEEAYEDPDFHFVLELSEGVIHRIGPKQQAEDALPNLIFERIDRDDHDADQGDNPEC